MSNYNNKYYQDYFYYYYLYNCNLNTINNKSSVKKQQNKKKVYRKKQNKMDIPIYKLNQYYIHSNNDINSNSPSVNVLINHYWPKVNIKYDNQNWIDFMNNV